MAYNYSHVLNNEVNAQLNDYIANGFAQAEAELAALSVGNNIFYRDLHWDGTSITEVSTGTQITTLPLQKQFVYYPQLLQLLVIGLDYSYYP